MVTDGKPVKAQQIIGGIVGRVWKPWPRRAAALKSAAPQINFPFPDSQRGVIP